MTVIDAKRARIRYRRSGAWWVAAMLAGIAAMPLAAGLLYEQPLGAGLSMLLGVILIIAPIAWAMWAWRTGVDVSRETMTIKAGFGTTRIRWSDVEGFTASQGRAFVVVDDGVVIPLPAVRPEDLPSLVVAAGQELVQDDDGNTDDSDRDDDTDAADDAERADDADVTDGVAEPESRSDRQES